jgi:dihydrofolate reductase
MKIIVAFCNTKQGIGYMNKIPWTLKPDLIYFKRITIGAGNNAVIMGSNTLRSIPYKDDFYNRLPKRDNLILSTTLKHPNVFNNKESIKAHCAAKGYDDIWIIGGGRVYEEFIDEVDEIYVTRIWNSYTCDVFFPKIPFDFKLKYKSDVLVENGITYINEIYQRSNKGLSVISIPQ